MTSVNLTEVELTLKWTLNVWKVIIHTIFRYLQTNSICTLFAPLVSLRKKSANKLLEYKVLNVRHIRHGQFVRDFNLDLLISYTQGISGLYKRV